jgi:hypothetical protein
VIGVATFSDLAEFDPVSLQRDSAFRITLELQVIDIECSLEARVGFADTCANPFRKSFNCVLGGSYSRE